MRLPTEAECGTDPFLHRLRETDQKQFLSTRWGANQKFEMHRRVLTSVELVKRYLPKGVRPEELRIGDFACGTANFGLTMAEQGYTVDLVDNEPKFFDYIRFKHTTGNIRCVHEDALKYRSSDKYHAIFFGEAIEHMAEPLEALKALRENLLTGGTLVLTTPNGDFVHRYVPNWSEVKDQKERNQRIANTLGNHVCEFTMQEMGDLVREAGYAILDHHPIVSAKISRSVAARMFLPRGLLWNIDASSAKSGKKPGGLWGKIQILAAQRVH